MKSMRLGIFPILASLAGEVQTTRYSDAVAKWLFDPANPLSIPAYWSSASGGELTIVPVLHAAATVVVSADVDKVLHDGSSGAARRPATQQYAGLVESLGSKVADFDGLVFLVGGRPANSGATSVLSGQRWIPSALLDDFGTLSFIQHEVGHVLGLDHEFDTTLTVAGGWAYTNGEYGDPSSIMAAESWGGRDGSSAIGAAQQALVPAADVLWARSGPGVSPATVWRYAPDFPAAPAWVHLQPKFSPPERIELAAADASTGTRLVVMPGDRSPWYTLEYRPARHLDSAFSATDATKPTAGLVIHEIRDVGVAGVDGWPKPNRVCYLAAIASPSAGDLDWSNGEFSVRLISGGQRSAVVEVGHTLPTGTTVTMAFDWEELPSSSNRGSQVEVSGVGERCTTGTYTSIDYASSARLTATASTTGMDHPRFQFELNGTPLGGYVGKPGPVNAQGTIGIDVQVAIPQNTTTSTVETRHVLFSYTIKGNAAVIETPAGDGAYDLTLQVRASDDAASDPVGIAATPATASITTRAFQLPPEAITAMGACVIAMAANAQQQLTKPKDHSEVRPNWSHLEVIDDVFASHELLDLGNQFVQAVELQKQNPALGDRLIASAATKLAMSPQQVQSFAAQIQAVNLGG